MTLDRFDRALIAAAMRPRPPEPPPARVIPLFTRPVHALQPPDVIGAPRGPRYVDHAMCPMCGTAGEGVTYQGELRSGAKVHTLQAHSHGLRCVRNGEPRCLGSGLRMAFVGGGWIGAPT